MNKRTKEEIQYDISSSSKVCRDCKERKAFKEFSTNNSEVDKKMASCKDCCSSKRSKTNRVKSFRTAEEVQQDLILGSKVCNRCGIRRKFLHFPNAVKGADGHDGVCYRCKPARDRQYAHLTRYKITVEEYNTLLNKQGSVCAICGKREDNNKSLAIDHDHVTGKVRGLLCRSCNTGLGSLGDTIESISRALEYLNNSL